MLPLWSRLLTRLPCTACFIDIRQWLIVSLVSKSHAVMLRDAIGNTDPGTTLTSFTRPIIGAKEPDPEHGLFTPPQAIDKLVNLLRQARRGDGDSSYGGQFYDWKAEKVPW